MIKIFLFIFLAIFYLNAKHIEPNYTLIASGGVTDLVLKDNLLYVSTTASSVDIFDIKTKEKIKSITVPKIRDFLGEIIDAKIYSVDVINDNILILSQGKKGGRNISIYKNGKISKVVSDEKRLFISKAKFIDENTIIYALLSNQVYLYDIKSNRVIKKIQISHSKFSDFALSDDKKFFVVADESGSLKMIDTKDLELIKVFNTQNVDNIFQVDIKNRYIISAGQDRRCAIYSIDGKISYYKTSSFLIYSVGLSPSAKLAAMSKNEDNDVRVFDVSNKENLYTLKNNKALLSKIIFKNENEIFVSSEDEYINYYKLK